jgi:hypothetical protein
LKFVTLITLRCLSILWQINEEGLEMNGNTIEESWKIYRTIFPYIFQNTSLVSNT